MKKGLLYIMTFGLLLTACKKEPLPDLPPETGPYYSVSGYINGEFVELNVGQEGILISQGVTDNNGVESYYGQILSPSEDLMIRIEFTRPELVQGNQGLSVLNEGSIEYLVHEPGCLKPNFGGSTGQLNFLLVKNEYGVFEPLTEFEFDEYGIHNKTLKFTDVSQNSFQIPIQYGYDPEMLDPDFQAYGLMDTTYFAANNTSGSHEWYVDGQLVGTSSSFHDHLATGIHKVEHKIIDQNYNEARHTTLVRVTDFVFDWKMDLSGCSTPNYESNYGKVTITVQTNGKQYTSDHVAGNTYNGFNVSDIEYVANSSGIPSRVVFDLSFHVTLVDDTGTESLSLSDMSGTFNIGLQ